MSDPAFNPIVSRNCLRCGALFSLRKGGDVWWCSDACFVELKAHAPPKLTPAERAEELSPFDSTSEAEKARSALRGLVSEQPGPIPDATLPELLRSVGATLVAISNLPADDRLLLLVSACRSYLEEAEAFLRPA